MHKLERPWLDDDKRLFKQRSIVSRYDADWHSQANLRSGRWSSGDFSGITQPCQKNLPRCPVGGEGGGGVGISQPRKLTPFRSCVYVFLRRKSLLGHGHGMPPFVGIPLRIGSWSSYLRAAYLCGLDGYRFRPRQDIPADRGSRISDRICVLRPSPRPMEMSLNHSAREKYLLNPQKACHCGY